MGITINELKSGQGLLINNDIYLVLSYEHVKPGKGSAFARVRMKNIKTQQTLERTFKSAEKLDDVPLEERKMQFLYRSGDDFHFMDLSSFDQKVVTGDEIGDGVKFLQENLDVTALCHEENVLKIILPIFIHATVVQTDLGLKGDSSRSGNKPATIDTGAVVQVPLFINTGDKLKIDTRTGTYIERL